MIVFWRLLVSMWMADFLLFHKVLHIQAQNRGKATLIRTGFFYVFAFLLCKPYLGWQWPFFGQWDMPGWVCILLVGICYALTHQFFDFGGKMRHGHLLTFFVKNTFMWLLCFLIAPLRILYETGHFFAQPAMIFLVGLILVTRILEWFINALEQDKYGSFIATFDEQWLLMMMRTIFYFVMLLPGVRWLILFVTWLGVCLYARKSRLLDVTNTVFYVSIIGSFVIGLLVRLRLYWLW